MKRCPKCNQEFVEEWLTFCTTDGTPLTEAPPSQDYPPPTMTMPRPTVTAPQEERPTMHMPVQPPYGGPLARPQYQQPVAPGWQAPPAPFAFAPQPNQTLAVASLITGVAGFVLNFCCYLGVITGPVAMGLGIVSLVQIKNNPKDYGGKPLAIIGIVAGGLSFVGFVLFILLGVASALWG